MYRRVGMAAADRDDGLIDESSSSSTASTLENPMLAGRYHQGSPVDLVIELSSDNDDDSPPSPSVLQGLPQPLPPTPLPAMPQPLPPPPALQQVGPRVRNPGHLSPPRPLSPSTRWPRQRVPQTQCQNRLALCSCHGHHLLRVKRYLDMILENMGTDVDQVVLHTMRNLSG